MTDTFLVPEKTVATAEADGPALALDVAGGVYLLTLSITRVIEQESLDLSIAGSTDGEAWDPKPLAAFPQKFYSGESPLLLDLTAHPEIKLIRAHWKVARWGRGSEPPMFEFHVTLRQVPQEILAEAAERARSH
jgi:hypothetical protein